MVNLHPQIDFLAASKRRGLAIAGSHAGPHFVGAQDKASRSDFAWRCRVHQISQDERRSRELVRIAEIRYIDRMSENAELVAVHVFQHDVEAIVPRTQPEDFLI